MTVEAVLLQRLVGSVFTRGHYWSQNPRLGLIHGSDSYVLRDRGWFPTSGEPVHATLRFARGDLDRMAAGHPALEAGYTLGTLDGAPRKKQAFALLALAGLGWCGPWPAAGADPEHVRLVRAAHYDLAIGASDGTFPLFHSGPVKLSVRVTHTVHGIELVTVGLSDTLGRPEICARLPPRAELAGAVPALRAAALWAAEFGSLPARIPTQRGTLEAIADPRLPGGLPLPSQHTWLMRVGWRADDSHG